MIKIYNANNKKFVSSYGTSYKLNNFSSAKILFNEFIDDNTLFGISFNKEIKDESHNNMEVVNYGGEIVYDNDIKRNCLSLLGSQYLLINSQILNSSLDEWTLEVNYKMNSLPTGNSYNNCFYLFSCGESFSNPGIDFYLGSSEICFSPYNYNNRHMTKYTPDIDNWHHIAFVKKNNNWKIILDNNVLSDNNYNEQVLNYNKCAISKCEPIGENVGYFKGKIYNYRISNIARY